MMSDTKKWAGLTVEKQRHNGLKLKLYREMKKRRVKNLSLRTIGDNIFEDAKIELLSDSELQQRVKAEGLEEYVVVGVVA